LTGPFESLRAFQDTAPVGIGPVCCSGARLAELAQILEEVRPISSVVQSTETEAEPSVSNDRNHRKLHENPSVPNPLVTPEAWLAENVPGIAGKIGQ